MSRGGVYTATAFICTLYEKNATWALFLVLEKNLHCLKIYMKNLLNDPSYIRPCGFHKALPYAIDCDLTDCRWGRWSNSYCFCRSAEEVGAVEMRVAPH